MPGTVRDSACSLPHDQALVTFSYTSTCETLGIDLFGSWDNFSNAYPMTRDSRRGEHVWKGCFHFKNIICDGLSSRFNAPRQGCLRQGGRYWYFYRLMNGFECCDDRQPISTECPLLPGQAVNLLDLPVDALSWVTEHGRLESERQPMPFTLDLSMRFQTMEMVTRIRRIRHRQSQPERRRPESMIPARRKRKSVFSFSTHAMSNVLPAKHQRSVSLPAHRSSTLPVEAGSRPSEYIVDETEPPKYKQFEHRRELVALGLKFGAVLANAFGHPSGGYT